MKDSAPLLARRTLIKSAGLSLVAATLADGAQAQAATMGEGGEIYWAKQTASST